MRRDGKHAVCSVDCHCATLAHYSLTVCVHINRDCSANYVCNFLFSEQIKLYTTAALDCGLNHISGARNITEGLFCDPVGRESHVLVGTSVINYYISNCSTL